MTVRWGVLGAARIAVKHMIPAMQGAGRSRVQAVASRDRAKAAAVASQFGIPTAHGSYDDLLADPSVDAIYVALPNHLHVPWSLRALAAGKHVLCEKPIALRAAEAQLLADAASRHPRLKVMEAFMYRCHPQWRRAHQIVAAGTIGDVRAIHTWFSYANVDPLNVRNIRDLGGGALLDIGCYGVSVARFIMGREPRRVSAFRDVDPRFDTDRAIAAMLDFGGPVATFTCGTQLARHQRVDIAGSEGRIQIDAPFNPPIDRGITIWLQRGDEIQPIPLAQSNQYTIQVHEFSFAILEGSDVPTPLADAVANMRAIDAVRQAAEHGAWVSVPPC